MTETYSFGAWLGQRRKALDMTQRELADRTSCALATIKKIEADGRRPSRDLADLLANALRIPAEARSTFVDCARGLRPVDTLEKMSPGTADAESAPLAVGTLDLPATSTPFIGRTAELTQIQDLLAQPACRWLTLVGPGGIGKTRLALEAARALRATFADGVVFVPLAAIGDAALIPATIAHRLRLTLMGPPADQLLAYLRARTMLLVLDNCEHLGDGLTWLSDLLSQATGIKVLATSRERLQLAEEWVFVAPELDEDQAVDLFAQTAQRTTSGFDLAGQRTDVLTICKLVENLPLAVELAAAWTPLLSCAQIADHIRHDIDFLATHVRNVPERHRSLRAVFDYSWARLSAAEQSALMRLSVFRGDWTVEEAEPVAGAALPVLRTLVEKSLVRATGNGRYDLHELTRQYAVDQLQVVGHETTVQRRHCEVYVALAERLEPQLHGPHSIAGFARFERDHDNFRAALSWALEVNELDLALRLVNHLFHFWFRRGYWQEAEQWMAAAVSRAGDQDSSPLCIALFNLIPICMFLGHFRELEAYAERSAAMARRLETPETLAELWLLTGMSAYTFQTDTTQALAALDESLSILQESILRTSNDPSRWGKLAWVRFIYGDGLRQTGHVSEAVVQFQKSLDIYRQLGNVDMIAYPLGNLGRLALLEGRLQEAYDLIAESVVISRNVGNRIGVSDWLHQLGKVALYLGDTPQAAACLEESLALHEEVGGIPVQVLALLAHVALARGDMGGAAQYLHDSLSAARTAIYYSPVTGTGDKMNRYVHFNTIETLLTAALVATAQASFERAITLFSSAQSLGGKCDFLVDPPLQAEVDVALSTSRTHLPGDVFNSIWEMGQNMSLEGVVTYALET
jgi:predicted ATPase/transcriptional regulator with XRE-family HTH domain